MSYDHKAEYKAAIDAGGKLAAAFVLVNADVQELVSAMIYAGHTAADLDKITEELCRLKGYTLVRGK